MMRNLITPGINELYSKSDAELRECLIELNNASLRKLARELVHGNNSLRIRTRHQDTQITKLEERMFNIAKLAMKEE